MYHAHTHTCMYIYTHTPQTFELGILLKLGEKPCTVARVPVVSDT